jgi:hypothetical protein
MQCLTAGKPPGSRCRILSRRCALGTRWNGNIVEFCEYARPAQTAEMAPGRGGDYRSMSRYLRAAMNTENERGHGYSFLGCRIAMTLPER